jgi:hypothetical protein
MTGPFDPYYKWLGIPPDEQPPNHYRLLAVRLYEPDADVIEAAAEQRMAHVRHYQAGPYAGLSQRILNELASARLCLLNPEKRLTYDHALRMRLSSRVAAAIPVSPPALPTRMAVAAGVPANPTAVPLDFVEEGEAHRMLTHRRGRRERSSLGLLVGLSAIVLAAVAMAFFVRTARQHQHVTIEPVDDETDEPSESQTSGENSNISKPNGESDPFPDFPVVTPHPVTLPDPPPDGMSGMRKFFQQFREPAQVKRQPDAPSSPAATAPAKGAPSGPRPGSSKPATQSEAAKPQRRNRTLAEWVSESIERRTLERSLAGGGGSGVNPFNEVPTSGALLTGFNLTVSGTGSILSVQSVFVGVRGTRGGPGDVYGTPRGRKIAVVARRGFAVAALRIQGESAVEGFEVEFARISTSGLDREDTYTGPWIGRRGSDPVITIGGDGLPAVGIYGRAGAAVYSLGLIQLPAE